MISFETWHRHKPPLAAQLKDHILDEKNNGSVDTIMLAAACR